MRFLKKLLLSGVWGNALLNQHPQKPPSGGFLLLKEKLYISLLISTIFNSKIEFRKQKSRGKLMKKYIETLKNNTELIKKFIINLITMSLFGIFLTVPVTVLVRRNGLSDMLIALTSLFAFLLFAFVVHDAYWQIGARNAIRERSRQGKADSLLGLKCVLGAYSPVILITLLIYIVKIINITTNNEVFGAIYGYLVIGLHFIFHGMYWGLFNILFQQNDLSLILFLALTIAFPSLSYYLGTKEIKFRSFFGLGDVDFGNKKD